MQSQQQAQHLKPCLKCLCTLIGMNIAVAFGVYFVLGFNYAISFFVAQVSAFLVVLSSFYAMKSKLNKHQTNTNENLQENLANHSNTSNDKQEDDDAQEGTKASPISSFILGVELSFGLYRVLAYFVLAVGIIVLMDLRFFSVLGYIAGVIVCLCSIVLFQLKGYK